MTIVSAKEIEILEPVGETRGPTRHRLAARVNDLNGKVLGLLSNHQPNADLLIDKLESLLTKRFNFAEVIKGEEPEIAEKCNALVTGIGH